MMTPLDLRIIGDDEGEGEPRAALGVRYATLLVIVVGAVVCVLAHDEMSAPAASHRAGGFARRIVSTAGLPPARHASGATPLSFVFLGTVIARGSFLTLNEHLQWYEIAPLIVFCRFTISSCWLLDGIDRRVDDEPAQARSTDLMRTISQDDVNSLTATRDHRSGVQ